MAANQIEHEVSGLTVRKYSASQSRRTFTTSSACDVHVLHCSMMDFITSSSRGAASELRGGQWGYSKRRRELRTLDEFDVVTSGRLTYAVEGGPLVSSYVRWASPP